MENRFYITGLPRSRTAWLARLFTFGRSVCLHDPIGRNGSIDRAWMEIDAIQAVARGISDSGLALVGKMKPEHNGRWLIIRRDFDEAARSFERMPRYGFEPEGIVRDVRVLRSIEAGLKAIESSEDCRVVEFDDLDRQDVVRSAWEFLLRGCQPWCQWHWEEMRRMRVVVRPEVT